MAELHILRPHSLGLPQARQLALRWAEQAETEFGLQCTYSAGRQGDEVGFSRPGVDGTLVVSHDRFELKAKLGFLLGAFKDRIEREIVSNFDALLAPAAAPNKTR
jgi:putative polyhydroxyalkanoate system protein